MHIYRGKDGRPLPSVTEIINKTRPLSEVIKLNKSIEAKKKRLGMTDKDWAEYMHNAQQRGTNTHTFMETYTPLVEEANGYINDGLRVDSDLLQKIKSCQDFWRADPLIGEYVNSLIYFFRDLNKQTRDWRVVSSEQTLVNEALGYGGRGDLLLQIGENYMMLDLKSNGGYWSSWKQQQVYHWNLWRKPIKEDVMTTKVYANGNTRQVKKKDANGKAIKRSEEMPPVEERDWTWVDAKIKDKFVQLCLYSMAMADMKRKGKIDFVPETAAILVAFPTCYQLIKMPYSVWSGCKEESIQRVEQYKKDHLPKWKLEITFQQS